MAQRSAFSDMASPLALLPKAHIFSAYPLGNSVRTALGYTPRPHKTSERPWLSPFHLRPSNKTGDFIWAKQQSATDTNGLESSFVNPRTDRMGADPKQVGYLQQSQ